MISPARLMKLHSSCLFFRFYCTPSMQGIGLPSTMQRINHGVHQHVKHMTIQLHHRVHPRRIIPRGIRYTPPKRIMPHTVQWHPYPTNS